MQLIWDFFKNIKNVLSLDFRSLFIVSIICWAVYFLPPKLLNNLDLLDLWLNGRKWVFVIGLFSTIWFMAGAFFDLIAKSNIKWSASMEARKTKIAREKVLMSTSNVEKEVIARYLSDDTTTFAFDYRDGIVNGLVSKGILYRSSQASNPMSMNFDFNIQPWVWEYLKDHSDFLKDITPVESGRHNNLWG